LTSRVWQIIALCVLLAAGLGYWWQHRDVGSTSSFRMAAVTRGDLLVTINATGTVEPEEVINVGA